MTSASVNSNKPTLLRRFLARLNSNPIGDGKGSVFFVRYDLLKTRFGSLYLHEFKRSDHDRCLHDHPWPFVTLILRGGYREQVGVIAHWSDEPWEMGRISHWRPPGYFGRYPATHAHRIEIDPSKPLPWSLVWVGRRTRPWGFWTRDGWRAWVKGEASPICEAGRMEAIQS